MVNNNDVFTINKEDAYTSGKILFTNDEETNAWMFNEYNPSIFYGPDGTLYILTRSTNALYTRSEGRNEIKSRIVRIDYTGDCHEQNLFDQNHAAVLQKQESNNNINRYRFTSKSLYSSPTSTLTSPNSNTSLVSNQNMTVKVYNIQGQLIGSFLSTVNNQSKISFWNRVLNSKTVQNGVYFIQYFNTLGQNILQRKQIF